MSELSGVPLDRFLVAPAGCYARGDTYLVFCSNDGLVGILHQAYRDKHESHDILRIYDALLARGPRVPLAIFIDVSKLVGMAEESFVLVKDYLSSRNAHLHRRVRHIALRVAPTQMSALAVGLAVIGRAAVSITVHDDDAPAFLALGSAEAWPLILRHVRTIFSEASLLSALRQHLATLHGKPRLPSIAKALTVSTRMLQRILNEHGTSMRVEIARASVEKAKALLLHSDSKLSRIAEQVGCSEGTLIARFRRLQGMTPSAYRDAPRLR